MRHIVTVSTDIRRCGVHSSVSSLTRWLQMAALQTLQCPRPSDCRLRQSSGLLQPCRHRGPIGARAWSDTGQWEAGNVKVGIPHPSVHPALQIQTAERQPAALQWGGCRVLSRDWGSITDHLQPPALAWDRSMSSAFSLATDLGPLIGPPNVNSLSCDLCSQRSTFNISPMTSTRRSELVRSDPQIRSFGILSPGGKTQKRWKKFNSINCSKVQQREKKRRYSRYKHQGLR